MSGRKGGEMGIPLPPHPARTDQPSHAPEEFKRQNDWGRSEQRLGASGEFRSALDDPNATRAPVEAR